MSCRSVPIEQEVRPLDGVGELGGQCGGFQQMTVDGVGVVGVALGFVADGRPLRDQPDEQAVLVERLDLVDGGPTEPEQGDERPRVSRPSMGRRAAACGRPGGAATPWRWDGPTRPRWRPGATAARHRRTPGRAASRRFRRRPRPCRGRGPPVSGSVRVVGRVTAKAPLRRRGGVPQAPPAPDVVADPGDLPARRRDGQHECVGIGEPERRRHLVLVLQEELVVLALRPGGAARPGCR